MRPGGKISAAIEILSDFETRRVPLKTCIADWARGARYAGAKDRAWISGLCLDVLRRRGSLALAAGDDGARGLVIAALAGLWRLDRKEIEEACADEHGPGPLTQADHAALAAGDGSPADGVRDIPDWTRPMFERAFGDAAGVEAAGFAERADIDLRLNTLKATPEKALAALKAVRGERIPYLANAARIAAPAPSEKAPAVTVIPAFNKGWVEVQDLGSQIAAAAAGDVKGAQVLDYCAGGGGKTLALAAMMENTGQLYAYDRDPRRLKPIFHRAKRAGVRNLQVSSPADDGGLDDLKSKMDVVFVDAPCTGAGTWRRHPDAKWRLTPQQLARRIAEQDAVLIEAGTFVRPGGRLIYVTCSPFVEENEDRLAAFRRDASGFEFIDAVAEIDASGLLTDDGRATLSSCAAPDGALRLSPARLRCDGFFIAVLKRG
ncbi:MAG: RsmB/NOP family class I SAM-dependent RNA methyltransferase [Pseudomonadota bacterium]